jgi:hypothetical protein
MCDAHFYGTDCLTYCHVSGRGMCNSDGMITCDSHYHGKNCLNYCEDTTHGNCSSDGKLLCDNNYNGTFAVKYFFRKWNDASFKT